MTLKQVVAFAEVLFASMFIVGGVLSAQTNNSDAEYQECVDNCIIAVRTSYQAKFQALRNSGVSPFGAQWKALSEEQKKAEEKCLVDCRNPPRGVPALPLEFSCAAGEPPREGADGRKECRHDCRPNKKCAVTNHYFWPFYDYWKCECVSQETPLKPLPSAASAGGSIRRPSLQEEENSRLLNKETVSGPYQCDDLTVDNSGVDP